MKKKSGTKNKRSGKSKLKRIIIVILLIVLVFVGYVEIVNINSKNMTYRQKVLKAIYPVFMLWSRIKGKNASELASQKPPPVSFYTLKGTLNNGIPLDFSTLKGKKVLLVNTASNCGYTNQYHDLQKLFEENREKLMVIGFPANDFKQQEKGSDEEIAKFCEVNFGVSFPLMQKSVVIRSPDQNNIFQWLTDSAKNGWNTKTPTWNFCKYLVNEEGILTNYFGSSISPLSKDVKKAINK
ncbi:MAG TPA: glutathione peroxidase [Chitinophagaceae bacterium]|nr:glutathione peroxidase [Chitinophagaceae bacterium]